MDPRYIDEEITIDECNVYVEYLKDSPVVGALIQAVLEGFSGEKVKRQRKGSNQAKNSSTSLNSNRSDAQEMDEFMAMFGGNIKKRKKVPAPINPEGGDQ